MTDTRSLRKDLMDEIENRSLGDKKFHSETSLQQFQNEDSPDSMEKDPGVLNASVQNGVRPEDTPARRRTVSQPGPVSGSMLTATAARAARRRPRVNYADDPERIFWESQSATVRELVGPVIYERLIKIFNLPNETEVYEVGSELSSIIPSALFYVYQTPTDQPDRKPYSMSDFELSDEEKEKVSAEEESLWSESASEINSETKRLSRSKSMVKSKSFTTTKKSLTTMSKIILKSKPNLPTSFSRKALSKFGLDFEMAQSSTEEVATSNDDLEVMASKKIMDRKKHYHHHHYKKNPHFDMLYCNESETDMIKWNSNYKQKVLEVSASDEFSKKAEIMTKQISKDFYDWWVGLGNVEFKSEIKRPEDIEDLFQVWFDEHASRGLVLDPKIMPCVLQKIASHIGVPKAGCPNVLKRQIELDIVAETSPAHTMAFRTCLPEHIKHIPPRNNTKKLWHCVKIPEELRSMAYVWEDIAHLTSTKSFQEWLEARPFLPMPPFFKTEAKEDKKQPFVVPSDYVVKERDRTSSSAHQDMALPVSQFQLELKEVLSKIMND